MGVILTPTHFVMLCFFKEMRKWLLNWRKGSNYFVQ